MSGYREGYVIYKRGEAFQLEIRYTGYENSFHLKGYSNYIPIDLMCRLIPVIESGGQNSNDNSSHTRQQLHNHQWPSHARQPDRAACPWPCRPEVS